MWKEYYIKISYYAEPDSYGSNQIKFKLDLSNYAIKSEVKKAATVDRSGFSKKTNFGCLILLLLN